MKNCKLKRKAIMLSAAMAVMSLLPLGAFAQDGLFLRGVSDEVYFGFGGAKEDQGLFGLRSIGTTGVIDNQTFGQEVPVGSGVILLLAAGAGYVILKRKEDEQ